MKYEVIEEEEENLFIYVCMYMAYHSNRVCEESTVLELLLLPYAIVLPPLHIYTYQIYII